MTRPFLGYAPFFVAVLSSNHTQLCLKLVLVESVPDRGGYSQTNFEKSFAFLLQMEMLNHKVEETTILIL